MEKENPFKEIERTEPVPEEIREKVLNDISSLSLISDFGDLFLLKFPQVIGSLFGLDSEEKPKKDKGRF